MMSVFGFFLILFGFVFSNPVNGEAIQLNSRTFDQTIASNELVVINFFVDWCGYSRLLQPIFDEAANMIHQEFDFDGLVVMAKVNCDEEEGIARRFRVIKYPTIKIVLNGEPLKHEYRGQRSELAIVEFVRELLKDPIKKLEHADAINELNTQRRVVIGYFEHHDLPEYRIFRRVASSLKDECDFHAGFGENFAHLRSARNPIIHFRPDVDLSHDEHDQFDGDLNSIDEFKAWAVSKCVPIVREITFDNAEELTEEGLPFLIMFHAPNDTKSVKEFKAAIEREMNPHRQKMIFLTADGKKFAHPLQHLGKSLDDLPVIAIDSFRHMYPLADFNHIHIEGKLNEFAEDLYSGKLHHEFHYGAGTFRAPHEENNAEATTEDQHHDHGSDNGDVSEGSAVPESSFKKLAPSKNRYTLRNEL